jgi:ApaG protein
MADIVITNSIKVICNYNYLTDISDPTRHNFAFAYKVSIENLGATLVKLFKRHWIVTDAYGNKNEIIGNGVIGQQPIIVPQNSFEYISGCNIATPIGIMFGAFVLEDMQSNQIFTVGIPSLHLMANCVLN